VASAGTGSSRVPGGDLPLNPEYQSIPCDQHERLEFSVLRKIHLLLEYRRDSDKIQQKVLPLDVNTRAGAEWLKFKAVDADEVIEIRLDSIISFVELIRF